MGDRTTVYFTLGGKLTREAYDELLELIEQEDYIQDNEITETGDVRTALVEEKRFDIWIEEANYGNADPFPDFARQHGLAFEHRSEEHTSELQSLMRISYAVFCLKKKQTKKQK